MGRVAGSLRKVVIDGLTFDVAADVNVTLMTSGFETEGIPTSGRTMFKMTFRSPNAEGVVLSADPTEQDVLRQISERLTSSPMSVTLADNSVYRTVGRINFENVETEENKATIVIIPDKSLGAWELFAAS